MTPSTAPTALPAFEGATAFADLPRRAFVAQVMGLPISVHIRGPRARGGRTAEAVRSLFETLRQDDAQFSTWKPGSEVSRIRRGELHLADAGPRTRLVAGLCEQAAERTGGSFTAWLPGADGRRRFDPTGLVKGWTVEQATGTLTEALAALGAHDVLVSAGGDVSVTCGRTDTPDWRIAVEDPRDRGRTLLTIPMRRGAAATSGTAARGEHIVDPATGEPARGLLSATVIGPSLTWADVDATAAFVRGADAAAWIAARPGRAGVLVTPDGRVQTVSAGH